MAAQAQGRIAHTEDSIQALCQARYNTYRLGLVVVTAVAGVALAAAGLFAPVPVRAQGLLLLAGCMLFVGRDFPAIVRAESVIEARGGALPSSVCTFCAGHMELEEGGVKKKLRYEQLDRIVQDRQYLYLFFGPDSAVMVERAKIEPGTAEQVMDLVSQRSGKQWESAFSLLTFNIRDIIRIWDNRKAGKAGRKGQGKNAKKPGRKRAG